MQPLPVTLEETHAVGGQLDSSQHSRDKWMNKLLKSICSARGPFTTGWVHSCVFQSTTASEKPRLPRNPSPVVPLRCPEIIPQWAPFVAQKSVPSGALFRPRNPSPVVLFEGPETGPQWSPFRASLHGDHVALLPTAFSTLSFRPSPRPETSRRPGVCLYPDK